MSKSIFRMLGLVVILVMLFVFGKTKEAAADVSINVNRGPPPIIAAKPTEVVMIPDLQVYFVPKLEFDVFFCNGYWWSPIGSLWYRAMAHNEPWKVVNKRYVPALLYRVPKDYRNVYEKEQPIPYGKWKKQMKHREKEARNELKKDKKDDKQGREHGNTKKALLSKVILKSLFGQGNHLF